MMKREDVLMEALPYIQQFHGKTIVIKTRRPRNGRPGGP